MESVWDYPRPPRVEPCARRVRVVLGGETIVDSSAALRVLETSHPPGVGAQEGDFYGGWITTDVQGPFKGGRGTLGW